MCLISVDKKKRTVKKRGFGFKVFYDSVIGGRDGVIRNVRNIHRGGLFKIGRWYKSRRKRPIFAEKKGMYVPGFHIYRDRRSARCGPESAEKAYKVEWRGALATGFGNSYSREVITRYMRVVGRA